MKVLKVKLFDEEHEADLEEKINKFLEKVKEENFVDIRYSISTMYDYKSQVYCYSALLIYKEEKKEEDDD